MTPKNVRRRIAELPPIVINNFWDAIREEIKQYALKHDPYSLMSWRPILHTINIGENPPYLEHEKNTIAGTKYDTAISTLIVRFIDKIETPLLKQIVANLVHQAYHLHTWERLTGKKVEDVQNVVEVGGGIGMMRILWYLLNPSVSYLIYDFEELNILQEFMFEWLTESRRTDSTLFFPRYEHTTIKDAEADLVIGMWSLSEIPSAEERNVFIDATADSSSYLFAYQANHENLDNKAYFKKMQKPEYLWGTERIAHMSGENYYLVGVHQ